MRSHKVCNTSGAYFAFVCDARAQLHTQSMRLSRSVWKRQTMHHSPRLHGVSNIELNIKKIKAAYLAAFCICIRTCEGKVNLYNLPKT